jgi:hypothetical protein
MPESKTPEPKIITTAVIISLVAGILIFIGSFYANSFYTTIDTIGMPIGIVTGILVLLAAIMLKIRPGESTQGLRTCCLAWGSLILILSIISLIAGSVIGFTGSILGIVGATFALIAKV